MCSSLINEVVYFDSSVQVRKQAHKFFLTHVSVILLKWTNECVSSLIQIGQRKFYSVSNCPIVYRLWSIFIKSFSDEMAWQTKTFFFYHVWQSSNLMSAPIFFHIIRLDRITEHSKCDREREKEMRQRKDQWCVWSPFMTLLLCSISNIYCNTDFERYGILYSVTNYNWRLWKYCKFFFSLLNP